MNPAVFSPLARSLRICAIGKRTNAWIPVKKTWPVPWVYFWSRLIGPWFIPIPPSLARRIAVSFSYSRHPPIPVYVGFLTRGTTNLANREISTQNAISCSMTLSHFTVVSRKIGGAKRRDCGFWAILQGAGAFDAGMATGRARYSPESRFVQCIQPERGG